LTGLPAADRPPVDLEPPAVDDGLVLIEDQADEFGVVPDILPDAFDGDPGQENGVGRLPAGEWQGDEGECQMLPGVGLFPQRQFEELEVFLDGRELV
jgi:hypothetical protein